MTNDSSLVDACFIQPLPGLIEPAWTPRVGPRTVQPGAIRMSTPIGVVYTSPLGPWRGSERHGLHAPWRGLERHGLHGPWRRSASHGPGVPGGKPKAQNPRTPRVGPSAVLPADDNVWSHQPRQSCKHEAQEHYPMDFLNLGRGSHTNSHGLDRPRSYPGKDSIQSHQPRQGLDIQPLPELAEPAWTPRVGPRTVQPEAIRMSTPIGVVYTSPLAPWRGSERHGLHGPWRRSESHGPGNPGEVPNVTAPGSLAGSPKHKTQAVPGRCSGLSCCRPIRAASRARHAWARRSLLTAHRFGGLV